jgi:hypothetical protein
MTGVMKEDIYDQSVDPTRSYYFCASGEETGDENQENKMKVIKAVIEQVNQALSESKFPKYCTALQYLPIPSLVILCVAYGVTINLTFIVKTATYSIWIAVGLTFVMCWIAELLGKMIFRTWKEAQRRTEIVNQQYQSIGIAVELRKTALISSPSSHTCLQQVVGIVTENDFRLTITKFSDNFGAGFEERMRSFEDVPNRPALN